MIIYMWKNMKKNLKIYYPRVARKNDLVLVIKVNPWTSVSRWHWQSLFSEMALNLLLLGRPFDIPLFIHHHHFLSATIEIWVSLCIHIRNFLILFFITSLDWSAHHRRYWLLHFYTLISIFHNLCYIFLISRNITNCIQKT